MTHISCTRPGTAEPWSDLAVFSELFYQHRAGEFSEGREQCTATLHRSLWSVSQSAYLRGSLAFSHSTTQQLQSLQFWLKTCCCCPTGVLGSSNGKTRLQIRPVVQEHQLPTWTTKPVRSQRRCNSENSHSPVNFSYALWQTCHFWNCHTPSSSPTPSLVLKIPEFSLQ